MATSEQTLAAIDAEIAELETRVNSLQSARDLLVEEVEDKPAPKRARSTKSSTKSTRRVKVEEDDDEEETPRRRTRKASSTKSSKNGTKGGKSRKEVITEMLNDGQSPKEIAEELGIQPNYVYHVKRDLES